MKLVNLCAFGVLTCALFPLCAIGGSQTEQDAPHIPSDFLSIERTVRLKIPVLEKGLNVKSSSSRRLPPHWGDLDLSKDQKEDVYKVQQKYNDEIAFLKARIERLENERDAKLRDVLTSDQRKQLDGSGSDDENDLPNAPSENPSKKNRKSE